MSSGEIPSNETFKSPTLPPIKTPTPSPFLKEPVASSIKKELPKSSEVDYSPPSWSCPIPNGFNYTIEVIKNGQIIETIDLNKFSTRSFITIGRFPPCDIVMDHPSVSRHHCVLQYGTLTEGMGWYLYDMDSTHGTKLNKTVVPKRFYLRLRTGSVFQIAGSTRLFSLCGPDSETELRKFIDMNNQKQKMTETDEEEDEPEQKFYAKDPLRWLDDYLEREGLPMEFKFSQAGAGWNCQIELAHEVASGTVISATAETRREAQFQCALEACEQLDSAGILREFYTRSKKRTLAENDYYEEDEDTFYDRTGQIEEQRKKRRLRIEGGSTSSEKQVAHTYEELKEMLTKAENQTEFIQHELQKLILKNSCVIDGQEVMNPGLSFSSRMAISQMKSKKKNMELECDRLRKLVKIAAPLNVIDKLSVRSRLETKPETKDETSPISVDANLTSKIETPNRVEVVATDTDITDAPKLEPVEEPIKRESVLPKTIVESAEEPAIHETCSTKTNASKIESSVPPQLPEQTIASKTKKTRTFAPSLPEKPVSSGFGLVTKEELRKLKQPKPKQRTIVLDEDEVEAVKDTDFKTASYNNVEMDPETYATWVPPEGQTGDGRTKLNEKFAGRY